MEKDFTVSYEVAEGPQQLRQLLDNYLIEHEKNPTLTNNDRYILYTFGEQRSLIRVDTTSVPFHFRYCDLLGRPATKSVKETIAGFLWEKCGEKERYTQAFNEEQL